MTDVLVEASIEPEVLLSPSSMRRIGSTIGGESNWQADVGRQVGYSKSTMTRYLNGTRNITVFLARGLRKLIEHKIDQLSTLLAMEGMPFAGSPETLEAQALIAEAIQILHAQNEPD